MMSTSAARATGVAPRAATRRATGAVASRRGIPRAVALAAAPTACWRSASSAAVASAAGASSRARARLPGASPAPIARPAPCTAPRPAPRPALRERTAPRAFGEGLATVTWPLIQPTDQWGMWAAILCASSFGLWGNKQRWGARVGGASLLSTLLALFLSNIGVIPTVAPAYVDVTKFLLPLAVPLLLLTADLRRVVTCTGRVLWCFFLGSLGTTLGSILVRDTKRRETRTTRARGRDERRSGEARAKRRRGGWRIFSRRPLDGLRRLERPRSPRLQSPNASASQTVQTPECSTPGIP